MKKQFIAAVSSFVLICLVLFGMGWYFFGPTGTPVESTVFTIPQHATDVDIPHELYAQKYVRNESAFRWLYGTMVAGKTTAGGGYRLDGRMSALDVIRKLTSVPDFAWVVVREGLRKEQVGILLAEKLGWDATKEQSWNDVYSDRSEYREGVYFPDTYLLPRDESVEAIAKRFIDHFNEQLAPYARQFAAKDVKWTTGIKIASLIQREAGGPGDMRVISGVIWNRLDKGMLLQIDATIQYVKGNAVDGWWPVIKGKDTAIDSLYNTYLHKGLPPTPIANPGLSAIAAAANPEKTDCMFYLHDYDKQIHCSVTYAEHVENIKTYLQ